MGLEPARGNQRNMWGRWATPDRVDKDALSTGAPWHTTGTLGSGTTSTCQATTSPTSTSSLSRKYEARTPLSSRPERAIGSSNTEFWRREEWIEGDEAERRAAADHLASSRPSSSPSQLLSEKIPYLGHFFKNSCYSYFSMWSESVYDYISWYNPLIFASCFISSPEDGQQTRLSESASENVNSP